MSQHIENIIHQISFNTKHRKEMFLALPVHTRAITLKHLTKHIRKTILYSLSDDELVETLQHLDPDEISDMVRYLPEERQKHIIQKFGEQLRTIIEILTQFDPHTAAGLMNLDYIQVDQKDTFHEVANRIKKHETRTGRQPVIIVMDTGKFKGYLPGFTLGLSHPYDQISKSVRKCPSIKHNVTHKQVVQFFRQHPHSRVVVLGDKDDVLGIIYSDDILRLLQEQEASTLYDFAGVKEEESVTDTVLQKVQSRYKWLIINLGTAFLASFTVGLFDETISKYVLLAVYMPIVAGMGGNAATQTLAILVRGIAMKQISLETAWPTLRRELLAGIINGCINGVLVAAIVMFFNRDVKVAIILALAMIINLLVAGFFGTLIPLIMKKYGKDPATSATIFITTATDVLGFLAFLGLASVLLS